jgi:hypothetical protein
MARFDSDDIDDSTLKAQANAVQAVAHAEETSAVVQAEIDSKLIDHGISKEEEHWIKSYWRPSMGWLYMAICFFDFIMFPMISMFMPIIDKGFGLNVNYQPWQSLTLSNGGMIHISFGAILGITAYGRTKEKTNS